MRAPLTTARCGLALAVGVIACSCRGGDGGAPAVGSQSHAVEATSAISEQLNAALAGFDGGSCGTDNARLQASVSELTTTPAIPAAQSGETLFCATYNPKHTRDLFVLMSGTGIGWKDGYQVAQMLPGDENFVVMGDTTRAANDELGYAPAVSTRWEGPTGTRGRSNGRARYVDGGTVKRDISSNFFGNSLLVTHPVKGDPEVRDDPDMSNTNRSYSILLGGVLPQWLKVSRLLARKLWKKVAGNEPGANDRPLEDSLAKMIFLSMWSDRIQWVECDRLVKKCVQENSCLGYDRYYSILDSAENKWPDAAATTERLRNSFPRHISPLGFPSDIIPSIRSLLIKNRFERIKRQEFFAADLLQTSVWSSDDMDSLRDRFNYYPPRQLGLAAPNTDDNVRNQLGRWRQGWSNLDVMYAWGKRTSEGVTIRPGSWDWNHLLHVDLSQKPTAPYINSNTQHDAVSSSDALGGGALKCIYRVKIENGRPTGVVRGAIRGTYPDGQTGNLAQWRASTAITVPTAARCQDVLLGQTVAAADWAAPTGLTGANPNASARPCVGMVMRNGKDYVDGSIAGTSANILVRSVYYINRWQQKFLGTSSWVTGLYMTGGMFIFAAATRPFLAHPLVALAAWGFALHSAWTTGTEIWNEFARPPLNETAAPLAALSWGTAGSATDAVAMAPAATVCAMPDDQVLEIARLDAEKNSELVDCGGGVKRYANNIVRKDVEVVGSVARTSMSAVSEMFLRGEVQVRNITRAANNVDELSDFAMGDIVSAPNDSFRWCVMRSPVSYPVPPARQEGSGGTGTAQLLFKSDTEEKCRSENFLELDSLRQGNGDFAPDPDHYTMNYIRTQLNAKQFFPHWNSHIGVVVPLPMYGTAANHGDPQTPQEQTAEGWLPARKLFSRWPGNFRRPDSADAPPHNRGSLGISRMARIPMASFPGVTASPDGKFVYITPQRRASATDVDPRLPWGTCVRTNQRWDTANANVVVRTYRPSVSDPHAYDIGDIYFPRPSAFAAAADDTRLTKAPLEISFVADGTNKKPKIKIFLPADLNNGQPGTQALKLEGALRIEGQFTRRRVDGAWRNEPGAPRGWSLSIRQPVYYVATRTQAIDGVTYNYSEYQLSGLPTTATQGGVDFDTFSGYLWGYIDLVTLDGKKVDRYWIKKGQSTTFANTISVTGTRFFKRP